MRIHWRRALQWRIECWDCRDSVRWPRRVFDDQSSLADVRETDRSGSRSRNTHNRHRRRFHTIHRRYSCYSVDWIDMQRLVGQTMGNYCWCDSSNQVGRTVSLLEVDWHLRNRWNGSFSSNKKSVECGIVGEGFCQRDDWPDHWWNHEDHAELDRCTTTENGSSGWNCSLPMTNTPRS